MGRITAIRQQDGSDCGPACLACILDYYGRKVPVARIRRHAWTNRTGTSISGLTRAAQIFGLTAKGAKGNLDALMSMPMPAIAHLQRSDNRNHFVVLVKAGPKGIKYMDPASGRFFVAGKDTFAESWTGVLVMLCPGVDFRKGDERLPIFRIWYHLIIQQKSNLFLMIAGAILYTVVGFSMVIYVQKLFDLVIGNADYSLLHISGCIMIGFMALQACISLIRNLLGSYVGQVMDSRLFTAYFRKLVSISQQLFESVRTGDLLNRIGDAVKIRLLLNEFLVNILLNLFILIFSVAACFFYHWKLASLLIVVLPVFILLYFISNRINRKLQLKQVEASAKLESDITESLQNMHTIRTLNLGSYFVDRIDDSFFRLMQFTGVSNRFNIVLTVIGEFVSKGSTIMILWGGAYLVMKQELTAGELLSFHTLAGILAGPLLMLVNAGRIIQDATAATERLFDITEFDIGQDKTIILTPEMVGDIRFSDIVFRYGVGKPLFDQLNLVIRKGECTGIAGVSGSGKSTLASLVTGLYTPENGNVYIGGYPVRYIDNDSLHSMVGIVPQKVELFSGSLLENITIGDPDPDPAAVIRIFNLLGAENFIESFPAGLMHSVGEGGSNLSGGQRQLISIARMLYRDPEIVIFDEATSNLDNETGKRIQDLIRHLRSKRKTIIIIAHRLEVLQYCDCIHVLEDRRLAESGTHTTLLQTGGVYSRLWARDIDHG